MMQLQVLQVDSELLVYVIFVHLVVDKTTSVPMIQQAKPPGNLSSPYRRTPWILVQETKGYFLVA